jgi:hypothetical protein
MISRDHDPDLGSRFALGLTGLAVTAGNTAAGNAGAQVVVSGICQFDALEDPEDRPPSVVDTMLSGMRPAWLIPRVRGTNIRAPARVCRVMPVCTAWRTGGLRRVGMLGRSGRMWVPGRIRCTPTPLFLPQARILPDNQPLPRTGERNGAVEAIGTSRADKAWASMLGRDGNFRVTVPPCAVTAAIGASGVVPVPHWISWFSRNPPAARRWPPDPLIIQATGRVVAGDSQAADGQRVGVDEGPAVL